MIEYHDVWTQERGMTLTLQSELIANACLLLDFDRRISYYAKNSDTLGYLVDGNKHYIKPDLIIVKDGDPTYLYCYDSQKILIPGHHYRAIRSRYRVIFWSDKEINSEPRLTNIRNIKSNVVPQLHPDVAALVSIKSLSCRKLIQMFNCKEVEARIALLQLCAKFLLMFDYKGELTLDTQFIPVSSVLGRNTN